MESNTRVEASDDAGLNGLPRLLRPSTGEALKFVETSSQGFLNRGRGWDQGGGGQLTPVS